MVEPATTIPDNPGRITTPAVDQTEGPAEVPAVGVMTSTTISRSDVVKAANRAEKAYMQRAADLGCILCIHLGLGATPAEIHHPRTGTGMGRRAAHTQGIPLCPEHHRGDTGLHGLGRRAFEQEYELTEADLVRLTHAALEQS